MVPTCAGIGSARLEQCYVAPYMCGGPLSRRSEGPPDGGAVHPPASVSPKPPILFSATTPVSDRLRC
eukprot:scaffold5855_cov229-Prasinococcus_capsulatus_cf.AAC.2